MVALAFEVRAEQECAPQIQPVYRTWLELAATVTRKRKLRVRYVTFIVKMHFYAAETRSTGKKALIKACFAQETGNLRFRAALAANSSHVR